MLIRFVGLLLIVDVDNVAGASEVHLTAKDKRSKVIQFCVHVCPVKENN
jgi:hypothetical protein